jgi:hypothetical protein
LILLDLAKAFDKVPHNQLGFKLIAAGIHHELVDWLMDFLTGRSQTVQLFTTDSKCTYSQPCNILSGVPQGTVLWPILFLLYIHNMITKVNNHLTLYADDSKLFGLPDKSSIQSDLDHIQAWADRWFLSFNISKCNHHSFW